MLPEVAQSASRLMEALEKLSEWAGSGPGGNGPSGPPSDDVVRAFEEAMAGAPEEAAGALTSALALQVLATALILALLGGGVLLLIRRAAARRKNSDKADTNGEPR